MRVKSERSQHEHKRTAQEPSTDLLHRPPFKAALRSAAGQIGAGLLLLTGLCLFVPWAPLPLTFYYEYSMHLAADKGWQFGTDILATYGPLGFIGLPFYREFTYPILISTNICLYVLTGAFLWQYWHDLINSSRPPAIWIVLILLLPGMTPVLEWTPTLFVPFVLVNILVLRQCFAEVPVAPLGLLPLVGVLALFVLVKGSFIFLICAGVAVVGLDEFFKWRRVSWLIPAFLAAGLLFWTVSGQELGHLVAFFRSNIDLSLGYKDGMSVTNLNNKPPTLLLLFLAASLSLVATFYWTIRKRLGGRGIWPTGMFAATFFVVFQHGFIRIDGVHTTAACLTFCSLYVLILPLLWKLAAGKVGVYLALVANGTMAIALIGFCFLGCAIPPQWRILYDRAKGLPVLVTKGTAPFKTATVLHLQQLKQDVPLPRLKEPLDCSTVDIGLAEAYGLKPIIRPTIALYQANTPNMSLCNQKYLEDPSGPSTVLVPVETSIDGRFPAVTDSLGLLAQKTHFQAIYNTDTFLVLERRSHPLKVKLVKLQEFNLTFNKAILAPDLGTDMLFARIQIEPTLAGRLFSLAYKPPETYIRVAVGTQTGTFRLISAMAKEGIILSPLLGDLPSFQSFYGLAGSTSMVKISAFSIGCQRDREWCYRDQIKVELFKLVVE
jgi:hypothetical protein